MEVDPTDRGRKEETNRMSVHVCGWSFLYEKPRVPVYYAKALLVRCNRKKQRTILVGCEEDYVRDLCQRQEQGRSAEEEEDA